MKSYKTVTRVPLLWWRMSDTVHLNAVHRLAEDVQISGRFHCCCYCRRRFCCCCCCCCCCYLSCCFRCYLWFVVVVVVVVVVSCSEDSDTVFLNAVHRLAEDRQSSGCFWSCSPTQTWSPGGLDEPCIAAGQNRYCRYKSSTTTRPKEKQLEVLGSFEGMLF